MTLSRRQVLELCEQFAALHDAELPIADLPGMNLDAAALQILEQRIREDREVRRLYVRYMRLCAALAWDMGGAQRGDESSREQPSACRIVPRWFRGRTSHSRQDLAISLSQATGRSWSKRHELVPRPLFKRNCLPNLACAPHPVTR